MLPFYVYKDQGKDEPEEEEEGGKENLRVGGFKQSINHSDITRERIRNNVRTFHTIFGIVN